MDALATLMAGLALAGLGVFQFMWAREARTHHHVPSGPFSGIEHDFAIVLSFFTMLVAAPAILGSFLALAARPMDSDAESCARGNAGFDIARPRPMRKTEWAKIVGLYDMHYRLVPSPIVAMNRAVALGKALGPEKGLAELRKILPSSRTIRFIRQPRANSTFLRAGRGGEIL